MKIYFKLKLKMTFRYRINRTKIAVIFFGLNHGKKHDYWVNYLRDSLFAHERVVCRWQHDSYILRAGSAVLADGFMTGEVSKNRQTIYSIRACRARPVIVTRMISPPTSTSFRGCLPLPLPASLSVSVSLTAATFCENFGVTQKLSQT